MSKIKTQWLRLERWLHGWERKLPRWKTQVRFPPPMSSSRGSNASENTCTCIDIPTHIYIILKIEAFLNVWMLGEGLFCCTLTRWMAKGQKKKHCVITEEKEGENPLPQTLKGITLFIRAADPTLQHCCTGNNLNTNVCRGQKQPNYSANDLVMVMILSFCKCHIME